MKRLSRQQQEMGEIKLELAAYVVAAVFIGCFVVLAAALLQ